MNSVGWYSYIREGPHIFFLNRALLRLNLALSDSGSLNRLYHGLGEDTDIKYVCAWPSVYHSCSFIAGRDICLFLKNAAMFCFIVLFAFLMYTFLQK